MFHLQQNFKHMQSDISQLGEEISVKMEQSFITAEENIEETKKQIGQTDIFNDTKYLPKNKFWNLPLIRPLALCTVYEHTLYTEARVLNRFCVANSGSSLL